MEAATRARHRRGAVAHHGSRWRGIGISLGSRKYPSAPEGRQAGRDPAQPVVRSWAEPRQAATAQGSPAGKSNGVAAARQGRTTPRHLPVYLREPRFVVRRGGIGHADPRLGQWQATDRAAEFEAEWLCHIPQQDQRQLED